MKFLSVFLKSLREQLRSYWVLLLTLSLGPFFILVYYLIVQSSQPHYNILILNQDIQWNASRDSTNYGSNLINWLKTNPDSVSFPLSVQSVNSKEEGMALLKDNHADALIILHPGFSDAVSSRRSGETGLVPRVEFAGDLTKIFYLVSAVWAGDLIQTFILEITQSEPLVHLTETPVGISGTVSEFDRVVPGLLIVSLIMLMFTASIAFVAEVEHKTIIRLKLSHLKVWEYLGGVGLVQVLVGLLSVLCTLGLAILLGFNYGGSVLIMLVVAGLTSASIIAFSLLIAAATQSATEVLIVGNFPMFLFMFFTGAAFPMTSDPWFTIWGIPINLQGFMSPTHAITALNKTLILDASLISIVPEVTAILVLSVLYLLIGGFLFKKRHLGLTE